MKAIEWKSNAEEPDVEIHYFVYGSQQQYVLGYNPTLFSKECIEKFIKEYTGLTTNDT